jgi:hypothetical protein
MQCLMLALTDEASWLRLDDVEKKQTANAFGEYAEALRSAGVFVASYRPQPSSTAKTVRVLDGKTEVRDGLNVETNEPLTGLYIINVPDMDAAITWAERNPAARMGAVELRPLITY